MSGNFDIILAAYYLLFTQKSYQEPIDKEFQRRYASVVLELERLNRVCCLYPGMLLYLDWSIRSTFVVILTDDYGLFKFFLGS